MQVNTIYQNLVQQWADIIFQQEGIDATTLPQWPVILQELQRQAIQQAGGSLLTSDQALANARSAVGG
jgi:hypothetical protein